VHSSVKTDPGICAMQCNAMQCNAVNQHSKLK